MISLGILVMIALAIVISSFKRVPGIEVIAALVIIGLT